MKRRNLSGLFLALGTLAAAEPRRIYLANDDHTDYLWSADAETYARVFVAQLDYNLRLADETAGNPPPDRARFSTDGSFWLWNYERRKSPADFARLIDRIKDGTIESPLNTLVSCYGAQPAEAVLRGLYYAGRLERRYGFRFTLANATENQGLPLGLASMFAGAGARYTWRGVCGCATKMDRRGLAERPHEIYWYAGHDGQRQLMKWYSLGADNVGTYVEAGAPERAIRWVETDPGFLRRYVDPLSRRPYPIIGLFGFGGDDLARQTGKTPPPPIPGAPGLHLVVSSPYSDHFHVLAQKLSGPDREVIASNERDFFADFERRYGASLATESVTHGNEWDLYSASLAETSARVKRAVEKLRAAELLATLVSLKYPRFMLNHLGARDEAFTDLGLYWEHDWTADGAISRGERAAWQNKIAATIEYYVDSLFAEGVIRLGGMLPPRAGAQRFFALNPLGWTRTDFADHPYSGAAQIHVRDLTTGLDVPHQLVRLSGAPCLRILARDVPPAGYKVYEIEPGPGTAPTDDAAAISGDGVMENAAIRLELDRDGAVRSLIGKRFGDAEFAATIGQLKLNDLAPGPQPGDTLRVENAGPVSVTLRARSGADLEHTTAITLYRDSDRVDIRNEITENFSAVRSWAFSFNLKAPAVHTEEVCSINLDKLSTDGGDYACSQARYDYVTVNHFADLSAGDNRQGVTISNPDLAFAQLGNSTPLTLDTQTPQIRLLAGGQVDGRWLGIPDENGASYFLQRFALRPHGPYDPVAAMRFALEHQNPLVTGQVLAPSSGAYPKTSYSLLSVSNPAVLVWAIKPADDGIDHGIIVRLWNLSEAPANAELSLQPGISAAQHTTHIETDLEAVALDRNGTMPAHFAREQLQTYRLGPGRSPPRPIQPHSL